MQVLFDTDSVVQFCKNDGTVHQAVKEIEKWCRNNSVRVWLYTGSVQKMHTELASTALQQDVTLDVLAERLKQFTSNIHWLAALGEDGHIWTESDFLNIAHNSIDAEAVQLMAAVRRLGEDAFIITGDTKLAEQCEKALTAEEFIQKHVDASDVHQNDIGKMQFCDLKAQLDTFRPEMERAVLDVVESTRYIKGPPVGQLEQELSDYLKGDVAAIACGSGTDALLIALMALDVRPGDEVIVPDFTFIATGEVVSLVGAVPVFCDVDPVSFNLDPERLAEAVTEKTVGIIPVSIFGQCADMDRINTIADEKGLWVMEDGAQSFGAVYRGRKSCTLTKVATTSFFPAKPLGCYGDGGAIFTRDADLADRIRMILNHGQAQRYRHAVVGVNGRMDTIQAAVVSVKLKTFDQELEMRRQAAETYTELLGGTVETPQVPEYNTSVWAQYTVRHDDR